MNNVNRPFTIGIIFMILFLSSRNDWHPPSAQSTREKTLNKHREEIKEVV